jgi:glycerate kinase
MTFLLIPDSFKGTLSSLEICEILRERIHFHLPEASVFSFPIADGGEGTVDAFLEANGGKKIQCSVAGPYHEAMDSFFGLLPDGTAIVEMAACAGLPLVQGNMNPALTTTYGVGQLLKNAAQGCSQTILLGLGGSCTHDAGCGAASALGIRFLDKNQKCFIPTGATLNQIAKIDTSELDPIFASKTLQVMCDIDHPLYGESGAAFVFAPQKGASVQMVQELDLNSKYLAQKIQEDLDIDISTLPGGGAAGGFGAGAVAFLKGELRSGIEILLDTVHFDSFLPNADWVITGEGKLDTQSLRGKAVSGVAKRCKAANTPVIALVGAMDSDIEKIYDLGITAVFSINPRPEAFETAKFKAKENLRSVSDNLLRLLRQSAQ